MSLVLVHDGCLLAHRKEYFKPRPSPSRSPKFMDEVLPYANDVPYEAQLPDPAEQVGATSLKERIGNRIYLLEDSKSKKRKLAETDITENSDEHGENGNEEVADSSHRPNAILLQGSPITQLPTARVFAYATHFDAHPIGLEWVDDQTCVLIFGSRKSALLAWDALRSTSQGVNSVTDPVGDSVAIQVDDTNHESFSPAPSLPLALYPIEERINSVLGNKKSGALKGALQIRWALSSDVKKRGARTDSEFYKRHGWTAGKESLLGYSPPTGRNQAEQGRKRGRPNENEDEMKRQLDEEMDNFLDGEDEPSPTTWPGGRRSKARRPEDGAQDQDDERRALDSELESFLARGDSTEEPNDSAETGETGTAEDYVPRGSSLLDRTAHYMFGAQPSGRHDRQYRPLPRRDRRAKDGNGQRYQTDENGRWLHNAEVKHREGGYAYDEGRSGMRAWADESRRPKRRKTQAELDQELEQFSRETDC